MSRYPLSQSPMSSALAPSAFLSLLARCTTFLALVGLLFAHPAEGVVVDFEDLNAPGNGTGGLAVGDLSLAKTSSDLLRSTEIRQSVHRPTTPSLVGAKGARPRPCTVTPESR